MKYPKSIWRKYEILLKDLKALVNGGLIIKISSSKIKLVRYQFKLQLNYFEIWQTDSKFIWQEKRQHISQCVLKVWSYLELVQSEVETGDGDHLVCIEILNYHVVYVELT